MIIYNMNKIKITENPIPHQISSTYLLSADS